MPITEYLVFDLLFEKIGDAYRARVVDSPVGQAHANFALPFTASEIESFLARVGRRAPITGSGLKPEEWLKQFGGKLFGAVFHDEVLTSFRRSRDQAERENKGLRVKLRLNDVPELADLPWEYLYDADPARQEFLALSTETPIVRFLELPQRVEPLAAPTPLNLLAVLSSPSDEDALEVEDEWTRMNRALQEPIAQGRVTLTRVEPPTLDTLRAQLRRNEFHILHFIGHGKYDAETQHGALIFENEDGTGRAVRDEQLAVLLGDANSLRVVVLNACEGARASNQNPFAGVAPHLVRKSIPAVIAMQFPITDNAALKFSSDVYAAIADGLPIDAAVNEARRAIYFDGSVLEWGTPVLFMRAADGMIFAKEAKMQEEREAKREGRGGINISGGSIHVGGDIVSGDKIVHGDQNTVNIGAGATVGQVAAGRNITQTQGASVQDLAALFNAIYKQIDARASDPNVERSEIRDNVKNIENEIAKGENANANKVERWMKFLQELAPDILEVTANAILNPIAGVTTAIKKIAEKMRA